MLPESHEGTYQLAFSDPSFAGFECVMKRHTLGALKAASKVLHINVEDARAGIINQKDWKNLQKALDQFALHLVSWNYRSAEYPKGLPATRNGVDKADLVFVFQVYMVWLRVIIDQSVYADFETDDIPMTDIEGNDGE
jgi:hypothetical protein